MDLTVQAMVGVMSVTGFPDSPPVKAGVAIADFMAGVHMYAGIMTALWRRERTGAGARIEVPMFDATLPSLLSSLAMALGTADETPTRTGNRHGGLGGGPVQRLPDARRPRRDHLRERAAVGGARRRDRRPELADDERFDDARPARVENIDALDDAVDGLDRGATARRGRRRAAAGGRAGRTGARRCARWSTTPICEARGVLRPIDDPVHGPVRVFSSPIRYDGTPPGRSAARPPASASTPHEVLRRADGRARAKADDRDSHPRRMAAA